MLDTYSDLIGRTPMIPLRRLFPDLGAQVLGKLELTNPMSVKDRPVRHIIEPQAATSPLVSSWWRPAVATRPSRLRCLARCTAFPFESS